MTSISKLKYLVNILVCFGVWFEILSRQIPIFFACHQITAKGLQNTAKRSKTCPEVQKNTAKGSQITARDFERDPLARDWEHLKLIEAKSFLNGSQLKATYRGFTNRFCLALYTKRLLLFFCRNERCLGHRTFEFCLCTHRISNVFQLLNWQL